MDHFELLRTARRLCKEWMVSSRWPIAPIPILRSWQDRDSPDSHSVIAWTDSKYDPSWRRAIHDAVGEACVRHRGNWKHQRPHFERFLGLFFACQDSKPRIQMVSVTPSRVPNHLWKHQGRDTLVETLSQTPTVQIPGQPLRIVLTDRVSIPIDDLLWVERPGLRPKIVVVHAQRRFAGEHSHYWRAFGFDRECDRDDLERGRVPAMADMLVGTGLGTRVHSPMIQFWKIDDAGWVDLLNLGTGRDSGLVVDIRWTRQRFADLLEQDPYFAQAFVLLNKPGPKLVRR